MRARSAPSRGVSAIVSLVLMTPSLTFAGSIVRCEDSGYRHQHCSVGTDGRVSGGGSSHNDALEAGAAVAGISVIAVLASRRTCALDGEIDQGPLISSRRPL